VGKRISEPDQRFVTVAQTLRQQQNGQNPAPSRARVASTASANYQRIVVILANLETTWSGVRYIRQVVSQRAEGIELADLSASATETSRLANSNPAEGYHATPDGWLSQDRESSNAQRQRTFSYSHFDICLYQCWVSVSRGL
jgi:hypothetical protein